MKNLKINKMENSNKEKLERKVNGMNKCDIRADQQKLLDFAAESIKKHYERLGIIEIEYNPK